MLSQDTSWKRNSLQQPFEKLASNKILKFTLSSLTHDDEIRNFVLLPKFRCSSQIEWVVSPLQNTPHEISNGENAPKDFHRWNSRASRPFVPARRPRRGPHPPTRSRNRDPVSHCRMSAAPSPRRVCYLFWLIRLFRFRKIVCVHFASRVYVSVNRTRKLYVCSRVIAYLIKMEIYDFSCGSLPVRARPFRAAAWPIFSFRFIYLLI